MIITRVDREQFANAYNNGASYAELGEMFGISGRYARVLRDRLGLPVRHQKALQREMPADFLEVADRIGVSNSRTHYAASWATVARWAKEAGIAGKVKPAQRSKIIPEVPADWAAVAPRLYKQELSRHYNISFEMVRRLIEITGINSRPTAHEIAAERRRLAPPERPRAIKGRWLQWKPTRTADNDNDVYALAASFLRHTHANVHRCDIRMREGSKVTWGFEHGVPNNGRGYYFVSGKGVMTNDELLEMARERGFSVGLLGDDVAA